LRNGELAVAVMLVVAHLGNRRIHRQLSEVGAAQPDELGVEVGEVTELQQRVVGEIDTGDHVGGVKGHLFGFGEEVVGIAVKYHLSHRADRNLFLGNDFRRVE
jgi:hypothetical protein